MFQRDPSRLLLIEFPQGRAPAGNLRVPGLDRDMGPDFHPAPIHSVDEQQRKRFQIGRTSSGKEISLAAPAVEIRSADGD